MTSNSVMSCFFGRKWYCAVLLFAVGAVAAEFASKHYAGLCLVTGASTVAEDAKEQKWLTAKLYASRSVAWCMTGILLALFGITCWTVSALKREPGLPSIPTIVFAIYLLILMLQV